MPSVSGVVKEMGVALAGAAVRMYRRDTGALLATGISGPETGGSVFYSNLSALLEFDGADNSTVFVDSGPNTITASANGTAKLSTAKSKFTSASLYLTAANTNYVSIANSSIFNFGSGDFTISCFIFFVNTGSSGGSIFSRWSVGGTSGADFILAVVGGKLLFLAGTVNLADTGSLSTSAWVHVEISRYGNVWTMYRDGVIVASTTDTSSVPYTSGQPLKIGVWGDANSSLGAYISDLVVCKGSAIHTAAFTPPTTKFPNTPAFSRATGEYALSTSYTGEVQIVVLDNAGGATYDDLIGRATPA